MKCRKPCVYKATMEKKELDEILENHVKWLCEDDGKRADLEGANLEVAFLVGVNLREADLCGADIKGADLRGADLREANLRGADLEGAKLEDAFLEGAYLPTGIYQIVGAGCCNRCTTYDSINDRVICGCWNDDEGNHLDSFAKRIEEIYGANGAKPNLDFYQEYMAAIAFFKAMKELAVR